MNETYLEYDPGCLQTEKLEFKIFVMASLLAGEKLAYRGTLNDISRDLGYAGTADTRRNRRIREAIGKLEEAGLIKTLLDGNIYTISLSKRAERKAIKIARETVKTIRETLMKEKTGHDWSYTLKVLLYLYETNNTFIEGMNDRYYGEIACALNITGKQVGAALKQLEEKFQAITTKKHYHVEETACGEKIYLRLPTTINIQK